MSPLATTTTSVRNRDRHWLTNAVPLLLIVLGALSLRLWGVQDRLPDPSLGINPIQDTVVDETDRREVGYAWEMWRGGTAPLRLNPRSAEWPHLSYYVTLASQTTYRLFWSIKSGDVSADDFAAHVERRPDGLFLAGRLLGVLISLLSIVFIYRLGIAMSGAAAGAIAAILLATNSYVVLTSQHVVDPNLLAMTLVLAAALRLVPGKAPLTPRGAAIAGAMIGLAAASKYIPMVLVLAFIPLCARRTEGRWAFEWRTALPGLSCAVGAFILASPFLVLDWRTTLHDVAIQRERHGAEWVGQTRFAIALPTYLTGTIPSVLGWLGYAAGLVGIGRWLRRKTTWPIASIPILLLGVYGWLSVAQPRFILPGLPILMLGAAVTIVWISGLVSRWIPVAGAPPATLVALTLLTGFSPAKDMIAARHESSLPDSRREARRWIASSIPNSQGLATDVYGPVFNTGGEERPVAVWPFYATEARLVSVAYAPCWLEGLSFYAASSGVESRFRSAAERYPTEVAFYDWIRNRGKRVWDSAAKQSSGPEISIWALPSQRVSRAVQDSVWDTGLRAPSDQARLSVWCLNMANVTAAIGRPDLAAAWASRGLRIARRDLRERFSVVLVVSRFNLDQPESVLAATQRGLSEFPGNYALHLYRGMTLQAVGHGREAGAEYLESLRLNPDQPGAGRLQEQAQELLGH